MMLSTACVSAEPRFPIVVEVPVAMSMAGTYPNVQVEVVSVGTGARVSNGVDVNVTIDVDGSASAWVTWWGDGSRKRSPVGAYDVIVVTPNGRSTTCMTVERPKTAKAADRIRPPDGSSVEVIIIGRSEQRGEAK